ncbi:hypothetical protein [Flavobacterium terrigena]|uniref:Uncharacterized protein n=1 Tax=Flavobacterium terrigena TaxID=402734 RepID=A0A1H6T419_9FLAO|nr:hypothetical protein [Flavobacterium terrigena]SEI71020.1 hypothetical protein SAMN05660918_1497 [Flavobacterium terrigena]
MTAVVGILNKQAVAIAADSAVTIGGSNGNKIFNRANKVFTLSKKHPVGIMLYNSASFLSTPWEVIIKMYRKQLGSNSFPRVEDYKMDFIRYLNSKSYFTEDGIQKIYLESFFRTTFDKLLNVALSERKELLNIISDENKAEIIRLIELTIDESITQLGDRTDICPELKDITLEEFREFLAIEFQHHHDTVFTENGYTISAELQEKLFRYFYLVFKTPEKYNNYTGLIFVGYGEDELYPQLFPINVSLVFKDKLRYYDDERNTARINHFNAGAICPFAQTDVIDTILTGIDPTLDYTYKENLKETLTKYNTLILEELGDTNTELSEKLRNFDYDFLTREHQVKIDETKTLNYIQPLMNAVNNLSKEDLAEMAESLIYLTYLKRRITFAEESVGGPVDVAIISKGDGFIWIKRKHYFKPELNKSFFDNYFN